MNFNPRDWDFWKVWDTRNYYKYNRHLVILMTAHISLHNLRNQILSNYIIVWNISFYNIEKTLSNLIIVVTQSTRKFVVIHRCFIFSHSPKLRHLFGSMEFEFAIFWSPADQVRWIFRIHQEFKKELPESDVYIETTNLIYIF